MARTLSRLSKLRRLIRSSTKLLRKWGDTDQDEFYNAIIIVEVDQTPLELLHRGQALEKAADRVRERHWGPRTLDVMTSAWRRSISCCLRYWTIRSPLWCARLLSYASLMVKPLWNLPV